MEHRGEEERCIIYEDPECQQDPKIEPDCSDTENGISCEVRYGTSLAVVQANELIRCKQDELSIHEARLIRFVISQIDDWSENRKFSIRVADLAKYLQLDRQNAYRDIDALTTSILKKTVDLRPKGYEKNKKSKYTKFQWVSECSYNDGIVEIKLHDRLIPFIKGLSALFTKYNYSDIIKLPTFYSIRLYEILCSYWNMKFSKVQSIREFNMVELAADEVYLSILQLREYLDCQKKYPNCGDFIRFVIDPSLKSIIRYTGMRPTYKKIKNGRSIEALVFKFNDEYMPIEDKK